MRLIDADAITKDSEAVTAFCGLFKKCGMKHTPGCLAPKCEDCVARFFKHYEQLMPTIDAEPVNIVAIAHDKLTHYYFCRSCLFQIEESDIPYYNFCPHCGAKFDKD
jgi:hypothetical protein